MVYRMNRRLYHTLIHGGKDEKGNFTPGYGNEKDLIAFLRSGYGLRVSRIEVV